MNSDLDFALIGVAIGVILYYLPWTYITFTVIYEIPDPALLIFAVLSAWSSGIAFGVYRYERANQNRTIREMVKNEL